MKYLDCSLIELAFQRRIWNDMDAQVCNKSYIPYLISCCSLADQD